MVVFGLETCDTCRKALKALDDARLVDVRTEGLPDDVRRAALARFGAALVNTRSTTRRGLSEVARAAPAEMLLADHPALMKRPLIVTDGGMYLGWGPEVRDALRAES